jgi:Helicase associated domain
MFEEKWKTEKPDRYEALDKLGYWSHKKNFKNKEQKAWQDRFEALKAFHEETGHFQVPTTYRSFSQFGRWTNAQKKNRKNMKKYNKDRYDSLDAIGFWAAFPESDEAEKGEENSVSATGPEDDQKVESIQHNHQPSLADVSEHDVVESAAVAALADAALATVDAVKEEDGSPSAVEI